jgi:hypothetical protein
MSTSFGLLAFIPVLIAYLLLAYKLSRNADFYWYGRMLVDEVEGNYVDIYLDIPRQYQELHLKDEQ